MMRVYAGSVRQLERIAELDALGRARTLTPAETDELADLVRRSANRVYDKRRQLKVARQKVARLNTRRWIVEQQLAAARARVATLKSEVAS